MTDYKRYLQNQLSKVRTIVSTTLSNASEERNQLPAFVPEPDLYEELRRIAADRQSDVPALIDDIVRHYLSVRREVSAARISDEQKANNPLLLLDGICGQEPN